MKRKGDIKRVNKNWMLGVGLGVALISFTVLAGGSLKLPTSLDFATLKIVEQRLHEIPKLGQTVLHFTDRHNIATRFQWPCAWPH